MYLPGAANTAAIGPPLDCIRPPPFLSLRSLTLQSAGVTHKGRLQDQEDLQEASEEALL